MKEALTLALEALERVSTVDDECDIFAPPLSNAVVEAIPVIKEALARPEERNFCPRCGKRTADLTLVHTCTPPIAADPKAFHGFPSGSASTPNAGGKCVTAGETAPIKEIDPNAWAFDRGLEST